MMGYKVLTSLVGVPCHNYATFGHLLFTKQYLAVSQAVSGQLLCKFYPKLSEIKPQYLWVLPPEGYGLWAIAVVWVMKQFSLRTNSVDSKTYGI